MQIVTLSHFSTKSETYLGYFLYYYSHAFHRDLLVSEVITLLRHDAEIYRFHVGVPEYSYLTIRKLRAFGKKTKINKWRDLCRTLASQLEDHSTFAKKNRVKLGKSPMQITDFEPLLPSDTPKASVRLLKLLAGRGSTSSKEIVVGHDYKKSNIVVKGTGKKNSIEKDEEDENDDSNDEDAMDEEDDEEEEEEEEAVGQNGSLEDKVGGLDWSDDDE